MESIGIEAWVLWGLISVLLFIAEIFVPGFWLAPMGIGAIAGAAASAFTDSFDMQVAFFAGTTVVAFAVLRMFFKKYIYSQSDDLKTNADALSGKIVKVLEPIGPGSDTGKVRIGGEVWRAVSEDGSHVETDRTVRVTKTDGAKVIVSSVSDTEKEQSET